MPDAIETTMLGTKVSISTTSVSKNATLAQLTAVGMTYEEIDSVGNLGDYGISPNNVSYNTLGRPLVTKSKGVQDGGDLQIECAYLFDDPGQVQLREAAETKYNWAIKIEYADAPGEGWTNTVRYVIGIVSGPLNLGGGPDDFNRQQFTVGVNAVPLTVDPVEA